MRTIIKRAVPNSLTEWRTARMTTMRDPSDACTYEEMRRVTNVIEAVQDGLFVEQGGICAYTGHRLGLSNTTSMAGAQRSVDFHLEHLVPQSHCVYGQDADYANLVACWPRPNCGFEPAYGARKKGCWPHPSQQALFVSPLRPDCSARFLYNYRGEIQPAQEGDEPAKTTIVRLGLDDQTLVALRRSAIKGALNPSSRPIRLAEARKLLSRLSKDSHDVDQGGSTRLMPFCFAIQPAIEREIRKLEGIRKQV